MKLIDLYKQWMETGKLPEDGLCNCIPQKYSKEFNLCKPESSPYMYWANIDTPTQNNYDDWHNGFNPIRQTIVLLICAMCDEL